MRNRTVLVALAAATAVALLVVPGCGRKAAPQPPVIRVAQQTRDLGVYLADPKTRRVQLVFNNPNQTSACNGCCSCCAPAVPSACTSIRSPAPCTVA